MDELIEQMAAKAPAGPPCPACGHDTHLVVFGEQWCSRCRLLRPYPGDPRVASYAGARSEPAGLAAARSGRRTRAA